MFKKVFIAIACLLLSIAAVLPALSQGAENEPSRVFLTYIRELYYAKKLKQVSKYWIENSANHYDSMEGTREVYEMQKLKTGYVANPRIVSSVIQGERCLIEGTGVASDLNRTFPCNLHVIMLHEKGHWRIQYYNWTATIRHL